MATIIKEKEYHCTDDCKQAGCPRHTAKLTFQSTAMIYKFETGQDKTFWFDDALLETFIDLIIELTKTRKDSPQIERR